MVAIETKYDVIIVGAGPAGSSLAYRLIRNGIKCLLIDKARPGEKLCGGMITNKSVKLLDELYDDWSDVIRNRTYSLGVYDHYNELLQKVPIYKESYVVERKSLDNFLFNRYIEAGGDFLYGRVKDVLKDSNTIIVNRGTSIAYNTLIGADGANSTVRKYIDTSYKADGFCLAGMVNHNSSSCSQDLSVYLGYTESGYGWKFNAGNKYSIGIGSDYSKHRGMISSYKDMAKDLEIDEDATFKGAFIPYGREVKKVMENNILLIGDAAGLVDALTGEGIYYTLLSAKLAFDYIIEGSRYISGIKHIQSSIKVSRLLKNIILSRRLKRLVYEIIKRKYRFITYVFNKSINEGEVSYLYALSKIVCMK